MLASKRGQPFYLSPSLESLSRLFSQLVFKFSYQADCPICKSIQKLGWQKRKIRKKLERDIKNEELLFLKYGLGRWSILELAVKKNE